jgi:hypothetical protein
MTKNLYFCVPNQLFFPANPGKLSILRIPPLPVHKNFYHFFRQPAVIASPVVPGEVISGPTSRLTVDMPLLCRDNNAIDEKNDAIQENLMTPSDLGINSQTIADFCRRWKIQQLSVFGSAALGRLRPDSDIDLLVTFQPDADWTMFDHYQMENELTELLAREVDLVNIRALEENPNPIYRTEILRSAKVIYAA